MKPHYFEQDTPDADDTWLMLSIRQGYVPPTCLLGGELVYFISKGGGDPCNGCAGPREKCHGRGAK